MELDAHANELSPLVNCFWCERLHLGEHALSVCPECSARYSTMRALEMSGSYPLDFDSIDHLITRTSPGNYALGFMEDDHFSVFYVGRSDSDVARRLRQWVDAPSRNARHASGAQASWGLHHRSQFPVDTPARAAVGSATSAYTRFAYSYAQSAGEAYAKEWRNYDDFGGHRGLDNEREPFFASAKW
jgi:hypothetical protein